MTGQVYAGLFVAFAFGWPLWVFSAVPEQPFFAWLVLLVNTLLVALVWYYTTSSQMSFFGGLSAICASMMSGCANITFLYLPIVLLAVYLMALGSTMAGVIRGREYTQQQWIRTVVAFYDFRKRHYG